MVWNVVVGRAVMASLVIPHGSSDAVVASWSGSNHAAVQGYWEHFAYLPSSVRGRWEEHRRK
jgi:hypothetical protein